LLPFARSDAQNIRSAKETRKAIALDMKHVAWSEHVSGMKVSDVTCKLKLPHSTVSTVLNNKDECLKEVKRTRPVQSVVMENMVD
jgi:DNA-binding transcriptional regulator LsrR (DeoR family)